MRKTDLGKGHLVEHVASALHSEELSGDPDRVHVRLVRARRRRVRGRLTEVSAHNTLQRGRQVDIRRRLFLDRLQHAPLPARDDSMQSILNLTGLSVQPALE